MISKKFLGCVVFTTSVILICSIIYQWIYETISRNETILYPILPRNSLLKKLCTYRPENVICEGKVKEKVIALTINDGPSQNTEKILEILEKHDVKATFFVVGEHIERYPHLLYLIAQGGNEIGIRAFNYRKLQEAKDLETGLDDIRKVKKLVKDLTCVTPKLFRPPLLKISSNILKVSTEESLDIILTTTQTDDWSIGKSEGPIERKAKQIIDSILQEVKPGFILMLQETLASSVAALDKLIQLLQRKGFKFVTVSELLSLSGLRTKTDTAEKKICERYEIPSITLTDRKKLAHKNLLYVLPEVCIHSKDGAIKIIRRANTKERVVALTFDDGPDKYTKEVLEILKKYDVKATFFIIGEKGLTRPDLLSLIAKGGHEIGNHTFTHPWATEISEFKIILSEVERTQKLIQEITGNKPRVLRPPFFNISTDLLKACVKEKLDIALGNITLWDIESSFQSLEVKVKKIITNSTKDVKAGSIILLHETIYPTVQALPQIIERLKKEGFKFVTISTLLKMSKPCKTFILKPN